MIEITFILGIPSSTNQQTHHQPPNHQPKDKNLESSLLDQLKWQHRMDLPKWTTFPGCDFGTRKFKKHSFTTDAKECKGSFIQQKRVFEFS